MIYFDDINSINDKIKLIVIVIINDVESILFFLILFSDISFVVEICIPDDTKVINRL